MNAQNESTDVRTQIVTLARELGFDLCRFARADAPEHATQFLDWLDRGEGGEMNYLARNAEKRCDPQQVLPEAKTVIILALNYFQGEPVGAAVAAAVSPANPPKITASTAAPTSAGRIARYAWGDDYHLVIEKKLAFLDDFLRRHGGSQKCYVDTGPMLERDHAAAAGVGWHGKSTMLLNRRLGTWFFLAEILTTLEFAPDPPQKNYCGRCTRCIDACPTDAIRPDRTIISARCISYATIEHRGPLEIEVGSNAFGCDICQEVCPWNRDPAPSHEAFTPRDEYRATPVTDLLRYEQADFSTLFRKNAVRRAKLAGMQRNVTACQEAQTRD